MVFEITSADDPKQQQSCFRDAYPYSFRHYQLAANESFPALSHVTTEAMETLPIVWFDNVEEIFLCGNAISELSSVGYYNISCQDSAYYAWSVCGPSVQKAVAGVFDLACRPNEHNDDLSIGSFSHDQLSMLMLSSEQWRQLLSANSRRTIHIDNFILLDQHVEGMFRCDASLDLQLHDCKVMALEAWNLLSQRTHPFRHFRIGRKIVSNISNRMLDDDALKLLIIYLREQQQQQAKESSSQVLLFEELTVSSLDSTVAIEFLKIRSGIRRLRIENSFRSSDDSSLLRQVIASGRTLRQLHIHRYQDGGDRRQEHPFDSCDVLEGLKSPHCCLEAFGLSIQRSWSPEFHQTYIEAIGENTSLQTLIFRSPVRCRFFGDSGPPVDREYDSEEECYDEMALVQTVQHHTNIQKFVFEAPGPLVADCLPPLRYILEGNRQFCLEWDPKSPNSPEWIEALRPTTQYQQYWRLICDDMPTMSDGVGRQKCFQLILQHCFRGNGSQPSDGYRPKVIGLLLFHHTTTLKKLLESGY